MKLSKAIRPISYLKANASKLIREVVANRETLVITQNGEAKVVIQDLATYEEGQESLALLKLLAQSQKSKAAGRFVSAKVGFERVDERIEDL